MPDELNRLQRELYAKDEPEELQLRRKELGLLSKRPLTAAPAAAAPSQPSLANVAQEKIQRRRRQIRWLAAAIGLFVVFAAAVAATAAWRASRQVSDEDIVLEVRGVTDVTAGDEVSYVVEFRNDSRVAWQNVEVAVSVPAGFRLSESQPPLPETSEAVAERRELVYQVGTLAPDQTSQIALRGRLIGEEEAVAVVQAEITLTPENFPSGRFTKTAVATTRITAMPVDVSIDAPPAVGAGERLRAVIHVRNSGSEPLTGAVLRLAPDAGVELAVEDEEFSDGFDVRAGEWKLESIGALAEATRTVVLFVQGEPGEKRHLTVQVGVQDEEEVFVQREVTHVLSVSASELAVEQLYNGSNEPFVVFPEGKVEGRIRYANTGTAGLRNVIVAVQFEGAGLDARELELRQGAYDPTASRITWTSASVPQLALLQPGESGTLDFSFAILPSADFPRTETNFALVSMATIDSEDLPTPPGQEKKVISDRMVMSVGTHLTLDAVAFYDDGRLGITSTGPLPPRANQTTTYTVRLRLGSTLNDVGEARVVATLPDGVGYTGKTVVSQGTVQFDDRSRQVTWTIPLLAGGAGRVRPAEELHFQVSITPGANLIDTVVPLLQRLEGQGQDQFIEQLVNIAVPTLPTTQTAAPGKGQVEP